MDKFRLVAATLALLLASPALAGPSVLGAPLGVFLGATLGSVLGIPFGTALPVGAGGLLLVGAASLVTGIVIVRRKRNR